MTLPHDVRTQAALREPSEFQEAQTGVSYPLVLLYSQSQPATVGHQMSGVDAVVGGIGNPRTKVPRGLFLAPWKNRYNHRRLAFNQFDWRRVSRKTTMLSSLTELQCIGNNPCVKSCSQRGNPRHKPFAYGALRNLENFHSGDKSPFGIVLASSARHDFRGRLRRIASLVENPPVGDLRTEHKLINIMHLRQAPTL